MVIYSYSRIPWQNMLSESKVCKIKYLFLNYIPYLCYSENVFSDILNRKSCLQIFQTLFQSSHYMKKISFEIFWYGIFW